MKPRQITWKTEFRCSSCLTQKQVTKSHGTCPKCGNNSSGTVVRTTQHPFYLTGTWWKFWVPRVKIYKANLEIKK